MLTVGPMPDKFSVEKRADSDIVGCYQAITNYKDKTCFVIGGFDYSTLSSVFRYKISKDQWEQGTPDLKTARAGAAACSFGDSVFVFAGTSGGKLLNSVERINVPAIANGVAVWELI